MGSDEQEHSYEELREVVINVMLDARRNGVDSFDKLLEQARLELGQEEAKEGRLVVRDAARLHPNDVELVLEIVWDLIRQGILTLGLNPSNAGWPWLRLSRFGECMLQHGAYRFHNKAEFVKALRSTTMDVSPDVLVYLKEAVAAFYTDCLLAACVVLAAAAESEFLRMLEAAKTSRIYGRHFSRIGDGLTIHAKILRFAEAVSGALLSLPESARDLDDVLSTLRAILHSGRCEPSKTPSTLSRDQVFVYLQLFIGVVERLTRLRRALTGSDYPRLAQMP